MNTKNLLAILVGLIVAMLLGWLVYGMMLKDTMEAGVMPGLNKPEEEFVWWALIVANLSWVVLLTMLFNKMGITDFMKGATTALWIGFLVALCYDLYFWSATNMFTNGQLVVIDIVVASITNAITGGVIAWMLGRGNKPAAATA